MEEINLEYRKDFYSYDKELTKIKKYDKMNSLLCEKLKIEQEYKNKILAIENDIKMEFNDHKHDYKISIDAPPYEYGKVCTICGHTYYS